MIVMNTYIRKMPEDCNSCQISYIDRFNVMRCGLNHLKCDSGEIKRSDWCPLMEIKTSKEKKDE